MRLSDPIPQQLNDLADCLENLPPADVPPSQVQWADIRLMLLEHATFLRQFIIWKVEERFANVQTRAPDVIRRSGRVYGESEENLATYLQDIKSSADRKSSYQNP